MAKDIPPEKEIDGWTARMIADELGMAADAPARKPAETGERLRRTADAIMQHLN